MNIEFYKQFLESLEVLAVMGEGIFHPRDAQLYSCAVKLLALGGTEVEEEDVTIHIAKLKKFLIGIELGIRIGLAPGFQRSGCRPSPELL